MEGERAVNDRAKFRMGIWFAAVYLAIFALAVGSMFYFLIFHTSQSEFCGVLPILVTLPWSILAFPVIQGSGYVAWYETHSPNPAVYGLLAVAPLAICAAINAWLVYQAGTIIQHAGRSPVGKR